ncbi:DoxX family protein [Acidovorax sp. Leaf160]|uniref:DoxX family protein n=1 Tax=Acidovorax sp. Leaf160 TaxID=1736280 RepID=UPI0006F76AC7|nr:DoxX family protein [Acidovorax sp. Leaf160]KQR63296.1 GntR family transcriptional regulator [Acidovorax sp. Leaf160]
MNATRITPVAPVPASDDAGKLILRLAIGVLVLLHGIYKLQAGVGFIAGMLDKAGLPSVLAYGVYVGEIVAPVLLIVGLFTRAGAAIIVVNMLVAFGLVHMADLFALTKQGGWALELQGLYLFGALAVMLLGAGRYSVGGVYGRFN